MLPAVLSSPAAAYDHTRHGRPVAGQRERVRIGERLTTFRCWVCSSIREDTGLYRMNRKLHGTILPILSCTSTLSKSALPIVVDSDVPIEDYHAL